MLKPPELLREAIAKDCRASLEGAERRVGPPAADDAP